MYQDSFLHVNSFIGSLKPVFATSPHNINRYDKSTDWKRWCEKNYIIFSYPLHIFYLDYLHFSDKLMKVEMPV